MSRLWTTYRRSESITGVDGWPRIDVRCFGLNVTDPSFFSVSAGTATDTSHNKCILLPVEGR